LRRTIFRISSGSFLNLVKANVPDAVDAIFKRQDAKTTVRKAADLELNESKRSLEGEHKKCREHKIRVV